ATSPRPASSESATGSLGFYTEPSESFWERKVGEGRPWFEPFPELSDWQPPYAKWFLGVKLNVSYNCLDRHVEAGRGDTIAYYWGGEPEGERRGGTSAAVPRGAGPFAGGPEEPRAAEGKAAGGQRGGGPPHPPPARPGPRRVAA